MSGLANPIVQMDIIENPASSIIQTTLAKFIDMDNLFSTNNIILFVSLLITLLIVGIKTQIIPSNGVIGSILEKIPVVNNLLPARKQVEFATAPNDDDDDESNDEDEDDDDDVANE